jgi:monofunctional biosynthetic peptidoglycan transglycosylase
MTEADTITQAKTNDVAVGATEPPSIIKETSAPQSKGKRIWRVVWKAALLMLVIPIIQVALLRFIDPPMTTMMFFKAIGHLFSGEQVFWSHDNVSRDEMSKYILMAVVSAEDQRFYQHSGFDFKAIDEAMKYNERHPNKNARGASTISQQVAKNLFLPPWRNPVRKGIEAYYTILIEAMWPKSRIVEMYVNIAEFAPSVYGVQAGAQHHFKKDADKLTAQQAALMAAVLPNPERWSASKPTAYIRRRAARVQRQMAGIPTSLEEDGDPD